MNTCVFPAHAARTCMQQLLSDGARSTVYASDRVCASCPGMFFPSIFPCTCLALLTCCSLPASAAQRLRLDAYQAEPSCPYVLSSHVVWNSLIPSILLLSAACLLDSLSLVPPVQRLRLDAYRAEPLFLSLAAEYQRTKEVHMIMDSNP